jgi:16S rRNA (guanine527-N7)-methyltransferase
MQRDLDTETLTLTRGEASRLDQLRKLWRRFGSAMNLTGPGGDEALEAHIAEALLLVRLARRLDVVSNEHTWLDIGSGGGFPGLVVAAMTNVAITLVEPRERRASFLDLALATIGRSDCPVVRARLSERGWSYIEKGGPTIEPSAQCACSRATFPPARWLALASEIVTDGVVFGHLRVGEPDPPGFCAIQQVEGDRWSVRAYRVG